MLSTLISMSDDGVAPWWPTFTLHNSQLSGMCCVPSPIILTRITLFNVTIHTRIISLTFQLMWMNASFSYVIKQSHHQQTENDSVCIWWDILIGRLECLYLKWETKNNNKTNIVNNMSDWRLTIQCVLNAML